MIARDPMIGSPDYGDQLLEHITVILQPQQQPREEQAPVGAPFAVTGMHSALESATLRSRAEQPVGTPDRVAQRG